MRALAAVPVAVLLVAGLTGCGGGGSAGSSTSSPFPTAPDIKARGCSILQETDVSSVARGEDVNRLDLAPDPSVACATVFRGGAGQAVLTVSELSGGAQALRRLRATKSAELGAADVRPLTALGPGAFLARKRYLAFRHGSRIVVLETGYDAHGALVLSVPQLLQLARLVAARG